MFNINPVYVSIGALLVSLLSLIWNLTIELSKRKAKLELRLQYQFHVGGPELTVANLIIRNRSNRPTALLEIFAKNEAGEFITKLDSRHKIELPIRIGPWDVQVISFKLVPSLDMLHHIETRDIDDKTVVVRRGGKKMWHG